MSEDQRPPPPPAFTSRQPGSPVRFATTSNAFGLTVSPSSSTSSSHRDSLSLSFSASGSSFTNHSNNNGGRVINDNSPPSAGTVQTRRLRRPSMLSLARNVSFGSNGGDDNVDMDGDSDIRPATAVPAIQDPSSSKAPLIAAQAAPGAQSNTSPNPFAQQNNRLWGGNATSTPFLTNSLIRRTSSAPPLALEGLTTNNKAMPGESNFDMPRDTNAMNNDDRISPTTGEWPGSPARSLSRKGKAKMHADESTNTHHPPPFTGRPLPAPLLATLISERTPLEHEMRSEARLQRLLSSHPSALPLTPRAPKSVRGRFPETAGDDEDDEDSFSRSWHQRNWLGRGVRPPSSDSDSDDGIMEELAEPNEPVNAAFAAGMDMDRPDSTSGSNGNNNGRPGSSAGGINATPQFGWSGSGGLLRSNAPRISFAAAGQATGMVPSPGTGMGLPSAFGGLGMGGGGTPLASPTTERLELAGSPGAISVTSPSMMQYRESSGGSASVRPGKRKANQEDRFDPYKRPRGSSPSLLSASPGLAMSPSRGTPLPIPQSPSHAPIYSSALSNINSNPQNMLNSRTNRAYPRPMARSRSRAASPALSIGSTSGVLSTSLGNNGSTAGGRPSFSLGQAFIPTGPGSGIVPPGGAPQGLGSLGLLSLSNRGLDSDEVSEDGRRRILGSTDSRGSRGSMASGESVGGGGGGGDSQGMSRNDSLGADSVIMEED